ncbi:MAG: autotransporter domain-containing protein [Mesorhizobium sp.]
MADELVREKPADRRCLPLYASTALAIVLGVATAAQQAHAQSVVIDAVENDVSPPQANSPDWDVGGDLDIGIDGKGKLTISDGGTVSNAHGYIGFWSDGAGTVIVQGNDSLWRSSASLTVGHLGEGSLLIESGGRVENRDGSIGSFDPDSTGTVTVTGAGSVWQNSSFLFVGLLGHGTLTIDDGGVVSSSETGFGGDVTSTGVLNLMGNANGRGVLETGYLEKVNGSVTLNFDGGILRATRDEDDFLRNFGALTLGSGGLWIDSAEHNIVIGSSSRFTGSAGASLNKIGSGTLTLTGDNSTFSGTVAVLQGKLVVQGDLRGNASVTGGSLVVDGTLTGPVNASSGGTVTGDGQIFGNVDLYGGGVLEGAHDSSLTIVGNVVMDATAQVNVTLDQPSPSALFVVAGNLTLAGTLNIADAGNFGPGVYRLFDYTGSLVENGLSIGSTPAGYDAGAFALHTATAGQINLLSAAGSTLSFWDGGDASRHGNNVVDGGTGVWRADNHNWTQADGAYNMPFLPNPTFAVFWGTSGVVTVDNAAGDLGVTGMQFISNGYRIEGDAISLQGENGETIVRIDPGVTATIASSLIGNSKLVKRDSGTLILTGNNTFDGGVRIEGGGLSVSADANLGAAGAGLTIDNGRLITTASFSSNRDIDLNNVAEFDVAPDTTLSLRGNVIGLGQLLKHGVGTLVMTGDNIIRLTAVQSGILTIQDGGTLRTETGSVYNFQSGQLTEARITGPGSTWNILDAVYVGIYGSAVVTVSDGGKLVSAKGRIAFNQNDTVGEVVVVGPGSTWENSGDLYVGHAGHGTLTVDAGGRVSSSFIEFALEVGSMGTLNLLGNDAGGRGVLETGFAGRGSGTVTLNLDGGIIRAKNDEGDFLRDFGAMTLGSEGLWIDSADHDIVIGPSSWFTASGGSDLNKVGTGTLILTGDSSTFAGTTVVSEGTLIVGTAAGGALGGSLTVASGALLGGIGTVGSAGTTVTIAAGGIHAPGNSTGVQAVAGDYVNHGTLRIGATPAAANRIVVAGSVDITGATLELDLSPANESSWDLFNGPYVIIEKQSAGAVAGTFTDPVTQNLLFLDALLAYDGGDGNDVTLELVRNDVAFAGVGQTPNQIATGQAIDTLDGTHAVWRSIALTNDPALARASFDALSGEAHGSVKTALVEDSRILRNAANDRIRAAFGDAGASTSLVLGYGPAASPIAVAPDHDGLAFWMDGFGSWGTTGSDGNASRLDRNTGGLLLGADTLAGDWRIGLIAGYSHSSQTIGGRASSASSNNYHVGLYGGTQWGDLSFRTGAAYSWHDVQTKRSVLIAGINERLSADYHAGMFQAFGELGYGFRAGATRFEPFANLAYVGLRTEGFRETGGAAALSSAGGTTHLTFTTLGLRAEHVISLGVVDVTLRGMAGWRHAFGDVSPGSTHGFSAGGAFTIIGAPIARDSAVVEAGLDLDVTRSASFGIAYTGQFARKARDHGFNAKLNVRF